MATAEFSKFADIVSVAVSHLLGFEIAQLEFCSIAFFMVIPHKAHLTSHSRMSDFRLMIISLWLSRSLGPFLYSAVYSCHLFFFFKCLFIYLVASVLSCHMWDLCWGGQA